MRASRLPGATVMTDSPLTDAVEPDTNVAERLKIFIRDQFAGQCKILSLGDACTCPLCDVDRQARAIRELRAHNAQFEAECLTWRSGGCVHRASAEATLTRVRAVERRMETDRDGSDGETMHMCWEWLRAALATPVSPTPPDSTGEWSALETLTWLALILEVEGSKALPCQQCGRKGRIAVHELHTHLRAVMKLALATPAE